MSRLTLSATKVALVSMALGCSLSAMAQYHTPSFPAPFPSFPAPFPSFPAPFPPMNQPVVMPGNFPDGIQIRTTEGVYLGCFNCSVSDFTSIFNTSGPFHARLKRPDSIHGNVFANTSMCNSFADRAPELSIYIGYNDQFIGRLSINAFAPDSICNSMSSYFWQDGCSSLQNFCSSN